jgi:hypothetical protein
VKKPSCVRWPDTPQPMRRFRTAVEYLADACADDEQIARAAVAVGEEGAGPSRQC